jgi:hypothetical protein
VDDESRKTELVAALGSAATNPAVSVQIATVAEAEQSSLSAPVQKLMVRTIEGQQGSDALRHIREQLAKKTHLNGEALERELTSFTNSALSNSAQAQLHVLALKQIVETLSAAELATLSPMAHRQWADLVKRHAEAAQRSFASLHQALRPVFGANSHGTGPVPPPVDMQEACARLTALSTAVDDIVGQALAGSSGRDALGNPQFWQTLSSADALALAIAAKAEQP